MRDDRLPPHLGRVRAHRSGPQADEAAGSDRRHRAPAERRDVAQRPLRPQADRPRDRGHERRRSTRDGNEIYIIANPGEGLAEPAFRPDAARARLRSRCATTTASSSRSRSGSRDSWYLRSSYLWSRLFGNYSGLSQSDENGRTSPNVGRLYDYPMMMFQDGGDAGLRTAAPPIVRTSSRRSSSTSSRSARAWA